MRANRPCLSSSGPGLKSQTSYPSNPQNYEIERGRIAPSVRWKIKNSIKNYVSFPMREAWLSNHLPSDSTGIRPYDLKMVPCMLNSYAEDILVVLVERSASFQRVGFGLLQCAGRPRRRWGCGHALESSQGESGTRKRSSKCKVKKVPDVLTPEEIIAILKDLT